MSKTAKRVDYRASASRHCNDADTLMNAAGKANAGQLYGLSVECGLKAFLIKLDARNEDADGTIRAELKLHFPQLANDITTLLDGRTASALQAAVPHLDKMRDWKIEHRYWRANVLPLKLLPDWQCAAREMLNYLDNMNTNNGGL